MYFVQVFKYSNFLPQKNHHYLLWEIIKNFKAKKRFLGYSQIRASRANLYRFAHFQKIPSGAFSQIACWGSIPNPLWTSSSMMATRLKSLLIDFFFFIFCFLLIIPFQKIIVHFFSTLASFYGIFNLLVAAKIVALSLECDLCYPFTILLVLINSSISAGVGSNQTIFIEYKNVERCT